MGVLCARLCMRLWFCNSYIQAANWWEEAFCTKFALSKLLCTPIEPIRAVLNCWWLGSESWGAGHWMCQSHFMTTSVLNHIEFEFKIAFLSKVWLDNLYFLSIYSNKKVKKRDYLVWTIFGARGSFLTFQPSKKRHICLAYIIYLEERIYVYI